MVGQNGHGRRAGRLGQDGGEVRKGLSGQQRRKAHALQLFGHGALVSRALARRR